MADDPFAGYQTPAKVSGDDPFAAYQQPAQPKTAGTGRSGDRLKGSRNLADPKIPLAYPGLAQLGPGQTFDQTMAGASDVARAVGTAMSPALAGGLVAAPLKTIAGTAAAIPVQQGIQWLGNKLGFPGTGAAAGDVAGAVTGATVAGLPIRSPLSLEPPRFQSTPDSVIPSVIDHFLPAPIRVMGRVLANPSTDPKTASVLSRIRLQSPLEPPPGGRAPVWEGKTEPTPRQPPEFNPPNTAPWRRGMPSGRMVGTGEPAPAPARMIRLSLPQQFEVQPTPREVPEFSSLPGELPSGRVPGSPSRTSAPQWESPVAPAPAQPPTGPVVSGNTVTARNARTMARFIQDNGIDPAKMDDATWQALAKGLKVSPKQFNDTIRQAQYELSRIKPTTIPPPPR